MKFLNSADLCEKAHLLWDLQARNIVKNGKGGDCRAAVEENRLEVSL